MRVIAVHGGAGYHSKNVEKTVRHALRGACLKGLSLLGSGCSEENDSSLSAVCEAIVDLENDRCLNAGYGSNLTIEGEVECDASIMSGPNETFGAVGAVTGVKNPIRLANAVLQNTSRPHPLGRIPPIMLVADGAVAFAKKSGIDLVDPQEMKTDESTRNWRNWKERLEQASSGTVDPTLAASSFRCESSTSAEGLGRAESLLEDTVGAVACDSRLAAGVSSGGLLLKYPGRVGEAATFGAGCYVLNTIDGKFEVACSVSGTGEAIIHATLAKSLCVAISTSVEDIHGALEKIFANFIRKYGNDAVAGALILTRHLTDGATDCRLWCTFTAQSMAVGYASDVDSKPKTLILRQPEERATKLFITSLPLSRD